MSLVKSRFYWPGMDGDIEKYVRNCLRCIKRKAQGKTAAKVVVVDSTYPMDLVCMIFLSLEIIHWWLWAHIGHYKSLYQICPGYPIQETISTKHYQNLL